MKGLLFLRNSNFKMTDLPDPIVGEGDTLSVDSAQVACGYQISRFSITSLIGGLS